MADMKKKDDDETSINSTKRRGNLCSMGWLASSPVTSRPDARVSSQPHIVYGVCCWAASLHWGRVADSGPIDRDGTNVPAIRCAWCRALVPIEEETQLLLDMVSQWWHTDHKLINAAHVGSNGISMSGGTQSCWFCSYT
jgi:hypothetical protein